MTDQRKLKMNAESPLGRLRSSRRYSVLVVTAIVLAVGGLVVGLSLAGGLRGENQAALEQSPDDTVAEHGRADVVHNPPLLYEPGDRVALAFDLVCPGRSCGKVTGVLTLTADGAKPAVLTAETDDDHVDFQLPASASNSSEFHYHSEFTFDDGSTVAYPTADGTMSAVSISQATTIDLGTARFSTSDEDAGDMVVNGAWGSGPGEFGINAQLSGPSSFDIDPTTGDTVILDQVNSRVVRVSADGRSQTQPIQLRAGAPDLAVGPDGTLDVLYANAVSGASLQQFGPEGGKAIRDVPLATPSGNAIRRIGDSVLVEADDSYWVPISKGQQILPPAEQVAAAAPGLTDDEHLVIRKHLRELGNEVRVADSGPSGVRAWRLIGTTTLGPVLVAAPLPDGRVAVVQSQFDNDHSQYSILTLGDGEPRTAVAPQALYAGLYDPSEFRLDGDALYQVRTTKAGYSIYRYLLRSSYRGV